MSELQRRAEHGVTLTVAEVEAVYDDPECRRRVGMCYGDSSVFPWYWTARLCESHERLRAEVERLREMVKKLEGEHE